MCSTYILQEETQHMQPILGNVSHQPSHRETINTTLKVWQCINHLIYLLAAKRTVAHHGAPVESNFHALLLPHGEPFRSTATPQAQIRAIVGFLVLLSRLPTSAFDGVDETRVRSARAVCYRRGAETMSAGGGVQAGSHSPFLWHMAARRAAAFCRSSTDVTFGQRRQCPP